MPPRSPDRITQRYLGPDGTPLSKGWGVAAAKSPARSSRVGAPVPGARLGPGLVAGATRRHISPPVASALSPPSCSPGLTVPFLFFPRGSHLVVKTDLVVVVFFLFLFSNI